MSCCIVVGGVLLQINRFYRLLSPITKRNGDDAVFM